MSEATARGLIEARLATYTGSLEVFWPNTIEDAPTSTDHADGFILAVVQSAPRAAFQADTNGSGGTFRHPGFLIVSVYTPRGGGGGAGQTEADTIAALFRGKSDASGTTTIHYRAPNIRDVGADGQWYQIDVEVPFERDTQFTVT